MAIYEGKAEFKPKHCIQVTFQNNAEVAEMVAETFGADVENMVCFSDKKEDIRHIVYNLGKDAHAKGAELQKILADIDVEVIVSNCAYLHCRECGMEIQANPYKGIVYCTECWTTDTEFA